MDGFNTSPAELVRAGGLARSAHEDVTTQVRTLRAQLESLRGMWQGDAYTQFALLMERWDANARSLGDALASIAEAIGRSSAAYQAQEDEGVRQMSTISSALNP